MAAAAPAVLQAQDNLLEDVNGDGLISFLAFGDSITYGVGDGLIPGAYVPGVQMPAAPAGYPQRIAVWSGIAVLNQGMPGERLVMQGALRFPHAVQTLPADVVGIMQGSNDAIFRLDAAEYSRIMQRLINVAHACGKRVLLLSLPSPCCDRASLEPYTRSYSRALRALSIVNDAPLADIEKAWETTCLNRLECELYNIPEGLHPNSLGYDVIGQTVLGALFGIDIFSANGAADLESALGLPQGAVIVKPAVQ